MNEGEVILRQMRNTAARYLKLGGTLKAYEHLTMRALFLEALTREKGGRCKTARALHIHRNTMGRNMRVLGLDAVFPDARGRRPQQ